MLILQNLLASPSINYRKKLLYAAFFFPNKSYLHALFYRNIIIKMVAKTRKTASKSRISTKKAEIIGNVPLYKFWLPLASGKKVVVIYKDGSHKSVSLHNRGTKKLEKQLEEFNNDENIKVVLSSAESYDVFVSLRDKVKGKSVDYVISNYKKYFTYKIDGKILSP